MGEERQRRPEQPDEVDGSAYFFRAIGKQIKLLRERKGLTQRELGEALQYGEEHISSVERGRRTPQPDFLRAADEFLEAGGVLEIAAEEVAKARDRTRVRHPAWFRDYARLEAEAVELHDFSTVTVPGLFQTEDYARLTFLVRQPLLSEEIIERRVADRLSRQEILTRWPSPTVTSVVDESVLRRQIGGRDVQQQQLKHLVDLGRLRSTTIHVLPLACEDNAGVDGPFILLTPQGRQQVAYLEVQGVNRLITGPEEVRILAARYGHIRGQALTPPESLAFIEKIMREI